MKKALYRFFVPYLKKDGAPIPDKHRQSFFDVVEKESCDLNGGFTRYEANGGYRADNGDITREQITIFETYGVLPLPDERLDRCAEYLAQECLLVAVYEDGGIKYLEYKGKKEPPLYCEIDTTPEEIEEARKSGEPIKDFFIRKVIPKGKNPDMENFEMDWSDLIKKVKLRR